MNGRSETYPAARRQYAAAGRRPVLDSSTRLMSRTAARARTRAAAPKPVTIVLYGEVGWDIDPAEVVSALENAPGAVRMRINSPGGSYHDGLAIYNAMREHPARVEVIIDGLAASAASFIAMGASPGALSAAEDAVIMCHDAWQMTAGNEADHLEAAGQLGRASDKLASIYARRAGGPAEAWREVMRREVWYEAAEALTAGLIDRVGTHDSDREAPQWMTAS
jgi:ATP-dependent Clp endopeptidase proteolytic subunit ClpP